VSFALHNWVRFLLPFLIQASGLWICLCLFSLTRFCYNFFQLESIRLAFAGAFIIILRAFIATARFFNCVSAPQDSKRQGGWQFSLELIYF
jgi:hypothetical protein